MRFKLKMSGITGFSLVELSIVLTIIGVVLSGAIELATRKTESDRVTETNARLDAIEQALQLFVINNQRLPCPADATLNLTISNSGKELPTSGTPTSGCTGTNFNNSAYVYSGTVPTKTLGLSDKYMADDWDRRFTYVVDYRFANASSCSSVSGAQLCFKNTTISSSSGSVNDQQSITIKDSTGASISTEAVYVLISHGKNGNGAWQYNGSATRLAASSDTDETDNAGNDKAATFDAIFVQKDNTTTFDDIVHYSTKELIIDSVGGIIDSTTCTAATDAASQSGSGTDPCQGAASTVNCYALATASRNFCLQP